MNSLKEKILSVNKRHYPTEKNGLHSFEPLCVTVVLIAGEIGDYAAYCAITEDLEWVACFGDKLCFQEAQCHFPGIEKEKYRL